MPTPHRHPDWRLALGLAASLLFHGLAAVAIGMGSLGASSAPPPPPAMDPPKLTPGVDRSRAVTISWIGFEEPTPHEAQLAATDQPALARGPAPTPSPEVAATQPPVPPTPSVRPMPLAEAASSKPLPAIPLPPRTVDDLLAHLDRTPEKQAEKPKPTPEKPTKPAPAVTQPPAPTARQPGGGPRESSPTSQHKPRKIRPGKPIAMEGLQINTVAPLFSTITRLTSAPSNPLVSVTFDTKGKAVKAEILQSSGDTDVDRPVLDAVYQWTAQGKKLDELRKKDPKQRTTFEFRIMLR